MTDSNVAPVGCLIFLLAVVAQSAVIGWIIMILAGILFHAGLIGGTLAFSTSLILGFLVGFLMGMFQSGIR